jgi:hydrophobic/amphiphilic exporter-1 (mainly G- bacteria), HAE1 family
MTLSERAVNKPTTVVTIFMLIVALGMFCMNSLPVDMYPNIDLPYMIVYTTYQNAGPEEVERNVTRTLESSLSGVTGLKKMQSQSSTGSSMIFLEFNYGTNLDEAANGIRDKIDLVRSYLPDDSGTPVTVRIDPSMIPIMILVVNGNRTPEELRKYAEDIIQPRLEQIDGVASATVNGGREKSINIDIPRDRLEAYSLTITQVAQMISAQNLQSAGGTITSGEKNYSIKTAGMYKNLDDVRNTVISYKAAASDGMSAPEIKTIFLRDIADVYEGYKDESTLAYLDGKPSVMLLVQKQSGKNSVEAAHKVRSQIKKLQAELPADVHIIETMNTTDIIEQTIHEVLSSVIQGALLAIIVLFIFLRSIKSTVIIGLTIPISLIITLALMYFRGMSLNLISLAGLLIGVGMLVDNSIVILENIYTYRERGSKPRIAAVLGSAEMIAAVTSSTFTSICIFLPMIMFRSQLGVMGQMFEDFAFTIVFSLLCSLVVAIVLVPVLTTRYLRIDNVGGIRDDSALGRVNRLFTLFFDGLDNLYARGVKKVLHHRKLVIITLGLLFVGSILAVPVVGFIFTPETATDSITVDLSMPKGTRLEVTESVIRQFESIALQEIKGIKYSTVSVGGGNAYSMKAASSNDATLRLTLYSGKERKQGYDTYITAKDKLRRYFTKFPGAEMKFGSSGFETGNSGITIEIKSDDLKLARSVSTQLVQLLKDQCSDVVTEPTSDLEDGQPEVEIVFDRQRMYALGLTVYSVGNEIKANINGTTASRYEDNGDEIDMVVRLSGTDKEKLSDLEQIFVTNSSGQKISLSSFAHYAESTSPVTIMRQDQGRIVHVTAMPARGQSLSKVQAKIEKVIKQNIPQDESVTISFSGDYADMIESVQKFSLIILMAAALVFAVMASQFESFLDPFIVLFTIPLSFIGVSAIYLISRQQFSFITVMGVLMLVGVIVNNGIVLVDYTNLLRKRGYGLEEACIEAARSRLRPILMSTLTTVIALVPMALFPGEGAEMIQPISLTTLGGLTFGTMMTLFLMPTLYYIFNSRRERRLAKKALKQLKNKKEAGNGGSDK